nr:4499_t:CDS:2 [Entrophospora candida]
MRLRQVMEENSKLKCRIEELGKNRMDTTNLVAEDSEQSCKEIGKFEKYHKMMILPMTVYPIPTLNYWRIQIPEFSLRMILTGSNKVTAQIINVKVIGVTNYNVHMSETSGSKGLPETEVSVSTTLSIPLSRIFNHVVTASSNSSGSSDLSKVEDFILLI